MGIVVAVIGFGLVCAMLSTPADREAGRQFWRKLQWPLGIAAALIWAALLFG